MMSDREGNVREQPGAALSQAQEFKHNLAGRHHAARVWHVVFQVSTIVGIIALTALLYNIINGGVWVCGGSEQG